ncbi:efflux RND transporter periplasmic adaptor subunit [Sessilibacter sp. MAH4]
MSAQDQISQTFLPRLSLRKKSLNSVAVAVFSCLLLNACSDAQSETTPQSAPALPVVNVDTIEYEYVSDWSVYTGEFQAIETVQLRPRVDGYINKVTFEEGSIVAKGDVLFEIDPDPYQLELERAQAAVTRAEAQVQLAKAELKRSERLVKGQAVSEEEYGRRLAQSQTAEAEYQGAIAQLHEAELNMGYTQVKAPISGVISRANITAGNYVTAGSTVLTSIVSRDPMYVVFDTDEHTYINSISRLFTNNNVFESEKSTSIFVGFAGDEQYPIRAQLNFIDNQLNAGTGTIRIRALVDNPNGVILPGMVARVKMQVTEEYEAALIEDSAISTDQDKKYVLVVNNKGVIEYRPVKLGGLHDGKRIIRDGLTPGDAVVIGAGLRIRPGMMVDTKEIAETSAEKKPTPLAKH